VTILFFGAWHIPFLSSATLLSSLDFLGTNLATLALMLIHIGVFFAKVIFFIWFQMTIRWTLPRFRYDQIMKLGWKILLPLSLANILVTGLVILAIQ
jgi:NADH-quinone oxidoreductase subunit H